MTEKKEQIPTDDGPESKIGQVINKQSAIEGRRKEVNVEYYSGVAKLGQLLKDVDFPVKKAGFYSSSDRQKTFKIWRIS